MGQRTVLLITSDDLEWTEVGMALRSMQEIEIIGEAKNVWQVVRLTCPRELYQS